MKTQIYDMISELADAGKELQCGPHPAGKPGFFAVFVDPTSPSARVCGECDNWELLYRDCAHAETLGEAILEAYYEAKGWRT